MDPLVIVILTVLITVVLVLLVETLFRYVLMRPGETHPGRQRCPGCGSEHAQRCSSQVVTTSVTAGQINAIASNRQSDDPRVDIACETLSTAQRLTGSPAGAPDADGGGGGDRNTGTSSTELNAVLSDNMCSETVAKRSAEGRRQSTGHVAVCPQLLHTRPCSCWTTVSSDIRYENEDDGVVVYQARMVVPASCRRAPPRYAASEPRWTLRPAMNAAAPRTCSTKSCPPIADDNAAGVDADSKRLEEGGENQTKEREDEPESRNGSTSVGQTQAPWQRDSYDQYIARSSLFSEMADCPSPLQQCTAANHDLQTVNFNRVVRSAHQPTTENAGLRMVAANVHR